VLDPSTHRVNYQGVELKLGPTEFRLLHFMMSHAERVHSRAQLLDRVWGDHVFIEERTVDVHIRKVREKIGEGFIRTVKGVGYKFEID
jgi:two-component system phosphate regulon response regulator PhoB